MGIFDKLFKKKDNLIANSEKITMEDIEKIQLSLKDKMDEHIYNSVYNKACRLIPKKQYNEAIALFRAIEENATDLTEKGNCQNQIGVCYYFLGNFELALEYYTTSLKNGFDKDVVDYNIWEVCEKLMKIDNNNTKWAEHYFSLLPNGKYAEKAQKLI